MIHPTAMVHANARLASSVRVGPGCVIGADVEVGENTWIGGYCIINGPTRIGEDNRIYQFNSIGDIPQDKKYHGEISYLEMGDRNVIREYCTLNRGTELGGGTTRVGSDNWIMAYVHIAHDCGVGNHTVMANGTTLAGHVTVDDYAIFGAFTTVHQFCSIGCYSFSAMGSVILKDVPPFVIVAGNAAKPRGLNTEGLRRQNFAPEAIRTLRNAYKTLYKKGLSLEQATEQLRALAGECDHLTAIIEFLGKSRRGIVR
ncbi:MAG: acyl-ACP--UDP-N-acetylglucosamine O-acyltransferase [Gammaproteobacteria bacterium]